MIEKLKNKKTVLILIGIMLLSSMWLITKGLPYAHDIEFHYGRIIGLSRTIKNGDFLALIHDYFYGYGYATGLFYSNFYFYPFAILSNLGLSYMTSFKIMYLVINIITTLTIYYSLKNITKDDKISLLGTTLYMFSGYRILDIYPRGAMGEILSFMIIPLVILGLYELIYRDYKKWYIFSISFVLLLLCHLITTFLVGVFCFIFILCNYKKFIEDKNRIKYLIISGIVGVLLGGFFLFPIIEQKINGNINIFLGQSYFLPQDQIVSIKDFLIPTGFFNKHIGFVLVFLLPIRYFIKKKNIKKEDLNLLKFADIFFILGIIAWISTTKLFPWKLIGNKLDFIQFPWRLLIITTTFLTFTYIIYYKLLDNKKVKIYVKYSVIVISILYISAYSVQYAIINYNRSSFPENVIGTGEYLPYETDLERLNLDTPKYKTNNSDLRVIYDKKGTTVNIKYDKNYKDDTYIEIPLFNYLGYTSTGAKLENGNNNLIRLVLNDKKGTIKVYYKKTNIQKVSYIVSTITLIGLVIFIIKEKRR